MSVNLPKDGSYNFKDLPGYYTPDLSTPLKNESTENNLGKVTWKRFFVNSGSIIASKFRRIGHVLAQAFKGNFHIRENYITNKDILYIAQKSSQPLSTDLERVINLIKNSSATIKLSQRASQTLNPPENPPEKESQAAAVSTDHQGLPNSTVSTDEPERPLPVYTLSAESQKVFSDLTNLYKHMQELDSMYATSPRTPPKHSFYEHYKKASYANNEEEFNLIVKTALEKLVKVFPQDKTINEYHKKLLKTSADHLPENSAAILNKLQKIVERARASVRTEGQLTIEDQRRLYYLENLNTSFETAKTAQNKAEFNNWLDSAIDQAENILDESDSLILDLRRLRGEEVEDLWI